MAQSLFTQGMKIATVDVVGGVIGFPLWWYGRGLAAWTRGVWEWWQGYRAAMSVWVWVRNIFVPMYGSYDIAGRIISFFMRVAMIVLRSVAVVLATIFLSAIFLAYLVLPLVVLALVLYHGLGIIG